MDPDPWPWAAARSAITPKPCPFPPTVRGSWEKYLHGRMWTQPALSRLARLTMVEQALNEQRRDPAPTRRS